MGMGGGSAFLTPIIGLPLPVHLSTARQQSYTPPVHGYDRFDEKSHLFVEALEEAAGSRETPVVDFHRVFLGDDEEVDRHLYLADELHPS